MDIENVRITKKATYHSNHALYQLEYTINNNILSRIRATVNEPEADDYGNHIYIGSIHYENNMYSDLWVRLCCSVPDLESQPEYQTHKMVNLTVNLNRPDKPCNLSFL